MASISNALFGPLGPFERGSYTAVPLPLAKLLAEERIGVPQIPVWLSEARLRELVTEESETESLCPCPHSQYIEIAYIFFNSSRNPWAAENRPHRVRENVLRLFEDLVAIRATKIAKCM